MGNSNRVFARLLLMAGLALLLQPAVAADRSETNVAGDFQQRARKYLDWRQKVAGKAPSPTDSPEKLETARRELANKIRVARTGAKQGEIFSLRIAQYFRQQIADTLRGPHGNEIRTTLRDAEPVKRELEINQSYPENIPLQSTPPTLLLNLPELPKELEYRILDHELVLRDQDANIVVDYIPDALPGETK